MFVTKGYQLNIQQVSHKRVLIKYTAMSTPIQEHLVTGRNKRS